MKDHPRPESHGASEPGKVPPPASGGGHFRIVVLKPNDIQPELLWTVYYAAQRLQIPTRFLRQAIAAGDLIVYRRTSEHVDRIRALDALALYQRAERMWREKAEVRAHRYRVARSRSRTSPVAGANNSTADELTL